MVEQGRYHERKGKQSKEQGDETTGHNVYMLFEDTAILEHIQRQQGDDDQAIFCKKLDCIREGNFIMQDWEHWKQ